MSPDTAAPSLPRVSVIVLTYRQAAYIRPCLRSVLADPYPQLEVLVSDDHSPDATAQAVAEEVAAITAQTPGGLRPGLTVKTHCNPHNLGLLRHLNQAMGQVSGDIVVFCGGDDIFVPGRVGQLVAALQENGASVAYSNAWIMDAGGQVEGLMLPPQHQPFDFPRMTRTGFSAVPGCTAAWRREVFDHFGPLPENLANEDDQIGFRGQLLGGVAYVAEPLVYYRVHHEAISGWTGQRASSQAALASLDKALGNYLANLEAWLRCLEQALPATLPPAHRAHALDRPAGQAQLRQCQAEGQAVRRIMAEAPWLSRVRLILAHWPTLREPRNRLLFGLVPLLSRGAAVSLYKTLGRLFARRAHRPKDTPMPATPPTANLAFPLDQGAPGIAP